MGYVGIAVALVGVVQAVAWLGGRKVGARRRRQAAIVGPVCVVLLFASLLHVLVPDFWG